MNSTPRIVQFSLILARVALWTVALMVILFGLFTFPVIMVGGFIIMYILYSYVRHTRD